MPLSAATQNALASEMYHTKKRTIRSITAPGSSGVGAPRRLASVLFRLSKSNKPKTSDSTAATEKTEISDFDPQECPAVRFEPNVRLIGIESRINYSVEEHRAYWFQDDEYDRIQKDCVKQIKKMDSGKSLKDKKYCSRGLESHTKLKAISKRRNRSISIDAVLREQRWQRESGAVDENRISQLYYDASSSCQLWARKVGMDDYAEAEWE